MSSPTEPVLPAGAGDGRPPGRFTVESVDGMAANGAGGTVPGPRIGAAEPAPPVTPIPAPIPAQPAAPVPPVPPPAQPPPPAPEPGPARHAAAQPERMRPITRGRAEAVIMYTLLAVMALADAVGFWIALSELVQADSRLLIIVVAALSVGTVAVSHHIGQLVRSRRESCGGSVLWIGVLTLLWLGLAAVTFWIRAVTPPLGGTADGQTQMQMAMLFLGIYLITGALAMTHAYRSGDPVAAELRAARMRRRRLLTQLATYDHERLRAQGRLAVQREDIQREREQHQRELGLGPLLDEALSRESQLEMAETQGDPSATDGLTNPTPTSEED